MDKQQVNRLLAVMVQAIKNGTPNGGLYAAMMNHVDLNEYTLLLGILTSANLVTNDHDFLTLTDKGMRMCAEIESLLAN